MEYITQRYNVRYLGRHDCASFMKPLPAGQAVPAILSSCSTSSPYVQDWVIVVITGLSRLGLRILLLLFVATVGKSGSALIDMHSGGLVEFAHWDDRERAHPPTSFSLGTSRASDVVIG